MPSDRKLRSALLICMYAGAMPTWCSFASAQTQSELTQGSCNKFKSADAELNKVYAQILRSKGSDTEFVEALRTAQRAWISFREAHLAAIYPSSDPAAYGTVNPMCRCTIRERLTVERTKELRELWINGTQEGDVCAGSARVRRQTKRSNQETKR